MRDIAVTIVIIGSLPFILRKPYIGVLMWAWIGYMNPHRLCWGFAYNAPFAEIVGLVTIFSIAISRESKRIQIDGLTVFWWIFIAWMGITTLFAVYPESAVIQYEKILKIQLMTFFILMIMGTKERLNALMWVTVLSLAFFGVKGGIFTITTGGAFKVYGPAGSFIADNNAMALALLMIMPLVYYLRLYARNFWIRHGLLAAMILIFAAVLGSQSRGAFLAVLCVSVMLWLKGKHKVFLGIGLVLMLSVGFTLMPKSWHERMHTIETYHQDESAMGRINAWWYSYNVANDRLTGAGLDSWSIKTFAKWAPDPKSVHAAHSIYFSVLGDHGWPGLVMFVAILVMAWRKGTWTIQQCKKQKDLVWAADMARMIQVGMVAYFSGGAFLSLSYFDLPWQMIAMLVLLQRIVRQYTSVNESLPANSPTNTRTISHPAAT